MLANYVTHQTFWNIEQTIPDDPEFDPGKAKAAIAVRVAAPAPTGPEGRGDRRALPPAGRPPVGGQAKAMVVTQSRSTPSDTTGR